MTLRIWQTTPFVMKDVHLPRCEVCCLDHTTCVEFRSKFGVAEHNPNFPKLERVCCTSYLRVDLTACTFKEIKQ